MSPLEHGQSLSGQPCKENGILLPPPFPLQLEAINCEELHFSVFILTVWVLISTHCSSKGTPSLWRCLCVCVCVQLWSLLPALCLSYPLPAPLQPRPTHFLKTLREKERNVTHNPLGQILPPRPSGHASTSQSKMGQLALSAGPLRPHRVPVQEALILASPYMNPPP